MLLILKQRKATLQVDFGVAADVPATGVTVTVTDSDGNTIVNAQTAAHVGNAGVYSYALDPQPRVAELTAVWTGVFGGGPAQSLTTYASIVGQLLFTIADLRAFRDKLVADATAYPDALVQAYHDEIADFFQRECGVSFIPRYGRAILDGDGRTSVWLPNRHVSQVFQILVDGTALDADHLANIGLYPYGRIDKSVDLGNCWGFWPGGAGAASWAPWWRSFWSAFKERNVIVSYEHGWPAPPPRIATAAKLLARYELVKTDITDRMIAMTSDVGTVRMSIPSMNYPTGIPIVDATLGRWDEKPLFA